jgi:hypothetical protein
MVFWLKKYGQGPFEAQTAGFMDAEGYLSYLIPIPLITQLRDFFSSFSCYSLSHDDHNLGLARLSLVALSKFCGATSFPAK